MLYVQALKTFHINNIFLDLNQNESKLNVIPIILYVLTNRVGYFLIIFAAINNQNLFSLNSATHIVRNKFKILSNNILPSILPCQKIHLT